MDTNYEFLTEREFIWAEMLMQALRNHNIPCVSFPVNGAAYTLRTGTPEQLRIYIPRENRPLAEEIMDDLFPTDTL